MSSRTDEDVLVLRVRTRRKMPVLWRSTAAAAVALALGSAVWAVYSVVAGQVLLGVVVFAWSAYVAPGWWEALQEPAAGPELLRLDAGRVTVSHPGRGTTVAWAVDWSQVRALRVHETAVPDQIRNHLGTVTKVLTVEVLDHREVDGPDGQRELLLGWALLAGSTPTRARLQLPLARAEIDAVRRLAAWLAVHQPTITIDFDVMGPEVNQPKQAPSRVAILVSSQPLRTALARRLTHLGVRTVAVTDSDSAALTEELRTCTGAIAVDTDPDMLSRSARQAGLDRVLWALTRVVDPSLLVRPDDRGWTVLDLGHDEAPTQPVASHGVDGIAAAMVGLLTKRDSIGRQWRVGADGLPVATFPRA